MQKILLAFCLIWTTQFQQFALAQSKSDLGVTRFDNLTVNQFNPFQPIILPKSPGGDLFAIFPVPSQLLLKPNRLWYQSTTTVSNGLNSNVLQTFNEEKSRYLMNVTSDTTLGYDTRRAHISTYCSYHLSKQVIDDFPKLSASTPQSVAFGLKQILFSETLEQQNQGANINFEGRENFTAAGQTSFLLTPSFAYQHVWTSPGPCYNDLRDGTTLTTQMQMPIIMQRPFGGTTQVIRPIYSIGLSRQKVPWIFTITPQLTTNYSMLQHQRPTKGSLVYQMQFEIQRIINPNALAYYVYVTPTWYGDSDRAPGRSGFGVQLLTGLRFNTVKTPVNAAVLSNLSKYEQKRQARTLAGSRQAKNIINRIANARKQLKDYLPNYNR